MGKVLSVGSGVTFGLVCLWAAPAWGGNDNAFTYQGLLRRNDELVTAVCDLTLSLWDEEVGSNQIGPVNSFVSLAIEAGLFTVQVDFGVSAFTAQNRWLETDVQCPGDAIPITLAPRQELSASPRSFHALRATVADSAAQADNADALGGRPASDYVTEVQAGMGLTAVRLADSVTMSIADAGVTTVKIAPSAVDSSKIQDESITSDDIAANAVGNSELKLDPLSLARVSDEAMERKTMPDRIQFRTDQSSGFQDLPTGVHVGGGASGGTTIELVNKGPQNPQTVKIDFTTTEPDFNVRLAHDSANPSELRVKGPTANPITLAVAGHLDVTGNLDVAGNLEIGNPSLARIDFATSESDFNVRVINSSGGNRYELRVKGPGGQLITLFVAGHLEITGNATKPGGGSWTATSDRRLKKNIEPLHDALSRLLRLRGVSFEYKDLEESGGLPGTQIGLIAQEVEDVFPDWVGENESGYKTVTVRGLAALVVEALRELRQERDAGAVKLRGELTELRQRVAAMEGSSAVPLPASSMFGFASVPSIAALGMMLPVTFAYLYGRKRGAR